MLRVSNKNLISKENIKLIQTSWCTLLPTIVLFSEDTDKLWSKVNVIIFTWLYWELEISW